MYLDKEIRIIRELLSLTQAELAVELGVSFETINRWENGKNDVEERNAEKLYAYAYSRKIDLNRIYEEFYLEDYQNQETKVLFHGARNEIKFPVDLNHSRENNDFGRGFYLGENLRQAATYISNSSSPNVYVFTLDLNDLTCVSLPVSEEWMIAISYYRGWLTDYKNHPYVKKVLDKTSKADVIVAPIADNRMFDIISSFIHGELTTMQAKHCLSATNLGFQYVLKTKKAISHLALQRKCHISMPEKKHYLKQRLDDYEKTENKVSAARIEYRGKGKYLDEVLK